MGFVKNIELTSSEISSLSWFFWQYVFTVSMGYPKMKTPILGTIVKKMPYPIFILEQPFGLIGFFILKLIAIRQFQRDIKLFIIVFICWLARLFILKKIITE